MDPVSAKGLGGGFGGIGGVGGDFAKIGKKGPAGKFAKVRTDKLQEALKTDPNKLADNFMKTGRVEGLTKPSMSERVAMRDGIAFESQGLEQQMTNWRPNPVQAAGKTDSVAGVVNELNSGAERLESILGQLQSGKEFSPAELIGMQAEVHMLSEQIQLSSKLVDSAVQSLKQVMQQQA